LAKNVSRRVFVKQTAVGTAAVAGATSEVLTAFAAQSDDLPHQIVAALGDLFIPSASGDPGYKDLEPFGITEYVIRGLPVGGRAGSGEGEAPAEVVRDFNDLATQFFRGKTFLELTWDQRAQYLEKIIAGSEITDVKRREQLQGFYRLARLRILTVYYLNYPEHEVKRNDQGEIIRAKDDPHQITNPNTKRIVTGWDTAGYKGPLGWEEEEQQRARMKKMHPYWYEGDLVKLDT
jgi:hypothetical protein